jgi:pimeloyl-ACP methyl ester carboxylesterase
LRSVISLAARPLWRENLIWVEFASLSSVRAQLSKSRTSSPKSVLLIPGFMTGDRHLAIMRQWLEQAGHATDCAGMRFNVDCSEAAIKRLERRLERFSATKQQRVMLIGQSRGGLFARVLAVRRPDLVESIVTLGSPHVDPMRVHPALWVHGAALTLLGSLGVRGVIRNSCRSGECCAEFRRDLRAPFPDDVQFFSVYSRSDGIVDWHACLDDASQAIEIASTHCGMGVNPGTYRFLDALLNDGRAKPNFGKSGRAAATYLSEAA